MIRIVKVTPLQHFTVRLELTNGKKKIVDLEPYLRGKIFEPLKKSPALFRRVKVDSRLGTIVWENGADIDPDVLIGAAEPAWMSGGDVYISSQQGHARTSVKEAAPSYRSSRKKK